MTASEPQPAAPYAKLRWYQFRLRSLFLLTLLVAIGMSWLAVTIQNQRKQKAAAEEIEKAGGWVKSEPTWLGKLLRDDSLVSVTVVGLAPGSVTDTEIASLQGLNRLRSVQLNHTSVGDAGLVYLRGLSQLRDLYLSDTEITDTGLENLRGLTQLDSLWLDGTRVTDAGLVHLQGLSQLQWLYLSDTKVTDQGVKKLQQTLPNCEIKR
jgi:hypothetical protein